MNVQRVVFDNDVVSSRVVGGGVVPMSCDAEGVTRVLLGRERFINAWKGSCRWSGFEGTRKEDEDAVAVVVREFTEESMGVVCGRDAARERIESGAYVLRIVLRVMAMYRPERYHITYVLDVPYDDELPARFQRVRAQLEKISRAVQEMHYMQAAVLRDFDVVGDVVDDGECVRVSRPALLSGMVYPPWRYDGDALVAHFTGDDAEAVRAWAKQRDYVEALVATCDHGALVCERHEGHIQDAKVDQDVLEKDQVRWWSLDELRAVLANRGVYECERFRPFFMPVVQVLVEELTSGAPACAECAP
jgi:hypothetical protein